mmetsp:Transcript_20710/g.41046  ORF Transcript_20710/g.41046 Transcript_20710/m.41046 type:complete len:252 (+) Transcript_20710:70-825(+)
MVARMILGSQALLFFWVVQCRSYNVNVRSVLPKGSVGRRNFLGCSLIAASPTLLHSNMAHAAVPTYDEYLGGGGSVKKQGGGGGGSVSRGGASSGGATATPPKPFSASKTTAEGLVVALDAIDGVLSSLSSNIEKQDWGGVLAAMKSPAIANVLLKNEGRGSAVVETPKVVVALGVEEAWEEAIEALGELKDFAFENQVTFFNNEDRSQVEKLASDTGYSAKVDLSEPRRALKETRNRIARIREAAVPTVQ